MPRAQASIVVPGRIAEAEDLFYDTDRWPTWVDGFGRVVERRDDWPRAGGRLSWDSRPGGRGRVVERVAAFVAGEGQTATVEDAAMRGTQMVAFAPEGDDTRVTLTLEFEIKEGRVLRPLASFFARRVMTDSLRRTLQRFAVERESDLAPI